MMSPLSVMDYKHTPIDGEGARLDIFISTPAQHQLKCSWGAQSMILHTQDTIFSCSRHAASQRDNFLSILAECRLVVSSVAPGPVTQHSSHQPSTQPPAGTGWIDNIFHPLAFSDSYTVFSCELCIGGRLSISRTNINIIRNIDNVLELSEGIRPWGEISGPGSDTLDIHTRALQLSQLEHQPPTTRGSNEGYPKVHNHGETQFHVERPWGQHSFSIVS